MDSMYQRALCKMQFNLNLKHFSVQVGKRNQRWPQEKSNSQLKDLGYIFLGDMCFV